MNPSIHKVIAMAHVADVERSVAFYALLGLREIDRLTISGRVVWALLGAGDARLMLTRADGPVDPAAQAVLFYMYTNDLAGLRARVLAAGVGDGGIYVGQPLPKPVVPRVFEISPRDYMPEGEMRLHDPDGYVVLVGQAEGP